MYGNIFIVPEVVASGNCWIDFKDHCELGDVAPRVPLVLGLQNLCLKQLHQVTDVNNKQSRTSEPGIVPPRVHVCHSAIVISWPNRPWQKEK